MLNIGLKDTRNRLLIISDTLKMVTNGTSSVSMSFGGVPVYLTMIVEGSSSADMRVVKESLLMMNVYGTSTAEMKYFTPPSGEDIEETITFESLINNIVTNDSLLLTTHEGISSISTVITDTSTIS